jgi:hypothetical protein
MTPPDEWKNELDKISRRVDEIMKKVETATVFGKDGSDKKNQIGDNAAENDSSRL